MGKKEVLHVIQDLDVAGAQTVVMNYLRWFQDEEDYHIKVVVLGPRKCSDYEAECDEKGYDVSYLGYVPFTRIPGLRSIINWFRLNLIISKAISKVKPYAIHSHQTTIIPFITLPFALSGIPKKFHTLHSDPYAIRSGHVRWAKLAFKKCGIYPICVTEDQAMKAVKRYGIKEYTVIHNGLDTEAYGNVSETKEEIRASLGIAKDTFVIGSVGRFSKIKNHGFLLNIFAEFVKKHSDSILMLVGDGEEKDNIVRQANQLGILDKVLLTGQMKDVALMYKAMDLFMLTSFFESSSIVTVEAQLSGVRCVVADSIPSNVIISELVNRLPLNAGTDIWIKAIEGNITHSTRVNEPSSFTRQGVVESLKLIYSV